METSPPSKDWHNSSIHPGAIFVQLTTSCNAKCINCPHPSTYGRKGIHPKGVMTDDIWDKIIRDIQTMGYRNQVGLYLHHEPLLEQSLFNKINQINHETEAFAVISTNGSLLNEMNRKALIEAMPRIVHININSADKSQYQRMTGLNFETTINNAKRFIAESATQIQVEINCPVLPEVDVDKLIHLFPDVKVNAEYWANSRGGLLKGISSKGRESRFKLSDYCLQPVQNFNILFDGSVVLCCLDWAHESKMDFPNIMNSSILEIYNSKLMQEITHEFKNGNYTRYQMCRNCSEEMGFVYKDMPAVSLEKNLHHSKDIHTKSIDALVFTESSNKVSPENKLHEPNSTLQIIRNETSIKGECQLNILLTNHHLLDFTGSEVFTFTVADFLKRKGHQVTVLSKYVDDSLRRFFSQIGVRIVQHIEDLRREHFDVAHIHHNVMAMEVRRQFTNLPLVFLSHGVLPFLEQSPPVDIGIAHYLAVSEEVQENIVRQGICKNRVEIFRNIVDSDKFSPRTSLSSRPLRALILSNKLDPETENTIRRACNHLGIITTFVGMRFGIVHQDYLPDAINKADIVFTLGRGVIETMMCGRIPIVLDYLGGDGMVTPENFYDLMKHNFSGRTHNRIFSLEELIREIELYEPSAGDSLRKKALNLFDADRHTDRLIEIYRDTMTLDTPPLERASRDLINAFLATVDTTYYFSHVEASRTVQSSIEENHKKTAAVNVASLVSKRLGKLELRSKETKEIFTLPQPSENTYDILIPIYNAYEHLKRCIDSVLRHTHGNHAIYLLDDCSTDARVLPLLRSYEEEDARVHVIQATENRGFIHNVNRGFELSQNDVVILNSDTEVTEGWLVKMNRCRHSHPDIGIVSPLSNNATILSVPVMNKSNSLPKGMDPNSFGNLITEVSPRAYPELPTGVGFCMLISRDTLNLTGLFDPTFGLGYGEENDLCQRARAAGKKIVCCDDAYVHHYGEASFRTIDGINDRRMQNEKLLERRWPNYIKDVYNFCYNNPLREVQERIYTRMKELEGHVMPSILHVIHNFDAPGGTELHTRNIIDGLSSRFHSTVIYPASLPGQWIDIAAREENGYLRVLKLQKEFITASNSFLGIYGDLMNEDVEAIFSNYLRGSNPAVVHFQHLIGWDSLLLPLIAKHQGRKIILSLHDYYLLCPEYNLILPDLRRCGKNMADGNEAQCLYCLGVKRKYHGTDIPSLLQNYLSERKHIIKRVFKAADILISPSDFVRKQFIQAYGDVVKDKIITVPHGIEPLQRSKHAIRGNILKVGFLGNASDRKGVFILLQTAQIIKKMGVAIQFEIFGGISPSLKKLATDLGIVQHGYYERRELPRLLSKTNLVVIPSIWNETFCLTASESQMMGIPVLASDAGAISERIIEGKTGFLVPPNDAKALAAKLMQIQKNPSLLEKVSANLQACHMKTISENIEDYAQIYYRLINNTACSHFGEAPMHSFLQSDVGSLECGMSDVLTSIIILCYNGLALTRQCLDSLEKFSPESHEIILVDNGSSDDTPKFLRRYSKEHPNVKLIMNESNKGFAAGNNQAIEVAQGDYVVLLNNDVIVTEGWLGRMIGHMERNSEIGMVGPVTNSVSGAQLVTQVPYEDDMDQMHAFAREIQGKNAGKIEPCMRLVGFCLLIRKPVIDIIGGLDEGFKTGNYEDDDLCLRSLIAGYRNIIAQDVFVHHFGSMTFKENSIDHSGTMSTNFAYFLEKWSGIVDKLKNGYTVRIDKYRQVEQLNKWGESAFSEGDIARALRIFERALRIDPRSTCVLNNIGVIQWELGDRDAALETFQTVLRNKPDDMDAMSNLSVAIAAGGRADMLSPDIKELLVKHSAVSLTGTQLADAGDIG